jgi:HEPN domain-containing protein
MASDVGAGDSRDPRVWRSGLAAARQALRDAVGESEDEVPEPVEDPAPRRDAESVVERARRIAAWVNGVGDPDQLDDRR